jgi:C-terminal processing protease CtpA/Prc
MAKAKSVKARTNTSARRTVKKSGDLRGAARQQAAAAVASHLGATQTLGQFLATAGQLSDDDRRTIIDQAQVMIEQVYVHLGLKHAMHAVDPVQRLKLLRQRLASYSERAFHDEMISIYTHLRDLHTNYILPNPYRTRVAALPFRIEEYFDAGVRRYVVTEVSPTVKDLKFKRGVIPTHWNGVPIDRAVEINAEREAGSNLAARHAQGLESLTNRWMGMSLPPDEEWVIIRYMDGTTAREARFEWQVFPPGAPAGGVDPMGASGAIARRLGVDAKAEIQRRARKLLFAPEAVAAERKMASSTLGKAGRSAAVAAAAPGTSVLPDVFPAFGDVTTPNGTFGYIRLATFSVDDEAFLQEFIRIVGQLSKNGLILDVRGNGGGNIWAGERLLQLLTPGGIEPEQFSVVSTPLLLQLCKQSADLNQWGDSVAGSTEIGTAYSQGFSLTPVDAANSTGQIYQGPVVLIIDAKCYSTTDIFSAGFQDHGVGTVLGTSDRTGAGGANVWTHDDLRQTLPGADSPFRPLPGGTSFRVAIRRAMRVGPRAGVLLEDLGVTPDEPHQMTQNDVLNGNVDLINHAAKLLAGKTIASLALSLRPAAATAKTRTVTVTSANVDRVDLSIDGRPRRILDVKDGATNVDLAVPGAKFEVEAQGYRKDVLVAAARVSSGQ